MKIKVSDYIINFLQKNDINTLFTITGGFAMHLNDSFGRAKFDIYYHHHEQACAYAALGYSKSTYKPSIICTTSGVAATNAISPCLIAYQDSVPLLFISGQVKHLETIKYLNNNNENLRNYAFSDCDIISCVSKITKFSCEIIDITQINKILIETVNNLINGRPGPVWLSIPIDIQGMLIDDVDIPIIKKEIICNIIDNNSLSNINKLLTESKRPIILAGNGIKLSNSTNKFRNFINKYNIPIVTSFFGIDLLESDNKLYCGRVGIYGDRCGNFTIQNSDLILVLGSTLSQSIVGYRADWFARGSKIIYIDNDESELKKENINYTLKIKMDVNIFFNNYNYDIINYYEWITKCNHWKSKWFFEMPKDLSDEYGINPYYALKLLYDIAPENKTTLASSGSIMTIVWHMVKIKTNDIFFHTGQGDMGFELPASIGAQIANKDKMIITILGEGSLQFNIQELQTIIHNKLPIKILLFNNNAYGAIHITQTSYFKNKFGVDESSGISFPKTEKIASVYGIKYISVRKNEEVKDKLIEFLNYKDTIILEIFSCIQGRNPKLSAIKNEDGSFTNRPFEDMAPFLDREEFKNEMIVDIV